MLANLIKSLCRAIAGRAEGTAAPVDSVQAQLATALSLMLRQPLSHPKNIDYEMVAQFIAAASSAEFMVSHMMGAENLVSSSALLEFALDKCSIEGLVMEFGVYRGTSLAALGVAAHEAGHAIQHKVGYGMMSVRQNLVPVVRFAAPVAYFMTGFGFYLFAQGGGIMLKLGIAALAVMTLFQLVTLPVEFDASSRAKKQLVGLGIIGQDEMVGVNKTLDAAALTYVAAFVSSLGYLLYLLLSLSGSNRSDD